MPNKLPDIEENSNPDRGKIAPLAGLGLKDLENGEDLTVEEARQFDCCKGLNDEQIKEFLEVLKVFTEIIYAIYAKQKARSEQQDKENDFRQAA